jgi:hypothetical protein
LKPLELELKKLEDLSDAIVQDFALMRKREEEMRDTNGRFLILFLTHTTLTRIPFLSFQNQRITEYSSSVYSACAASSVSRHGKCFILEDTLLRRSSSESIEHRRITHKYFSGLDCFPNLLFLRAM